MERASGRSCAKTLMVKPGGSLIVSMGRRWASAPKARAPHQANASNRRTNGTGFISMGYPVRIRMQWRYDAGATCAVHHNQSNNVAVGERVCLSLIHI